jgi:sugar lactone lactonase YvrE
MYSIDTLRQTVFVRDYDPQTGTAGPREPFLTVDEGYPDGMCLDVDEHLWIAMWGLGQVHRYSPAGGLVSVIEVPAPHVSSVAFAGPGLDTLVITTATQDLTDEQLARFPDSGRLFTASPGVAGLPQALWSGSHTHRPSHKDED